MNITQTQKGENLISIKISVEKADYQETVEKTLKQMRQRANVPGFRPGMVPMGMIKKMYGTSAKMEALNNVVSENLNKYIFENKLNVIGYPLSDRRKAICRPLRCLCRWSGCSSVHPCSIRPRPRRPC